MVLGGSGADTEASGAELGHRIRWDINLATAFQRAANEKKSWRIRLEEWSLEGVGTSEAATLSKARLGDEARVGLMSDCGCRWTRLLVDAGRYLPPRNGLKAEADTSK